MLQAMQLRNLSERTIKSYLWQAESYVRMFGKSPEEMGEEEVQRYLHSLVERKKSSSMVRIAYSALKFLYVDTLHLSWKMGHIPRSRREKRLPIVLSQEEVKRIIEAATNMRQRMVLMVCYSAGLRISKVVHLKVGDIDSQRMQIRVEQGKGKKDRYTLLANIVLEQLRVYWKMYRPHGWLFAGRNPGKALTVSSVQRAFTRAKKKPISPSTALFTAFATVLPLTCLNLAPIFSSSRSFLAIQA